MLNILYVFFLLVAGATTIIAIMSLTSPDLWNSVSWAIVSLTWYCATYLLSATYCLNKRLEN